MGFFDSIRRYRTRPKRRACVKRFLHDFGMTRTGCRHEPKVATMAFVELGEEGWACPRDTIYDHLWEVKVCKDCMERFKSQKGVELLGVLDSSEYISMRADDVPMRDYEVFHICKAGSPFEVYYRFLD